MDETTDLLHRLLEVTTWRAFDVDAEGRILAGYDGSGTVQLVELRPDGTRVPLTALSGACHGRYLPGTRRVVVSHDAGGNERAQLSLLDPDAVTSRSARTGSSRSCTTPRTSTAWSRSSRPARSSTRRTGATASTSTWSSAASRRHRDRPLRRRRDGRRRRGQPRRHPRADDATRAPGAELAGPAARRRHDHRAAPTPASTPATSDRSGCPGRGRGDHHATPGATTSASPGSTSAAAS